MTTSKAALSPSRIADFRNCPLKFRFAVVDRIEQPPSREALRGTLVHAVLEELFDFEPALRSAQTAQERLFPAWTEHASKAPKDAQLFTDDDDLNAWIESARPLLNTYFELERPQFLEPAGREIFVNAVLPSGIAIRGIVDRLDEAPNGALRVVDYKTGKSPSPQYQAQYLFQMRFYATALYLERNNLPARTQLLFLKDGRTLTYDPTMHDVEQLSFEIEREWEAIEHALDTRNFKPRTSPLCKWCAFSHLCPAQGGIAPEMSEEGAQQLRTVRR